MLKKITPFILKIIPAVSLLFGAFVASNASAWDEVCVKFNDGLIEEGRFYVVYGFRVEDDGRFPTSYYDEDGERRLLPAWLHPEGYARPTDDSQPVALGRIRSSYGGAGSTRCVAINKLRPREPFFVYVEYLASWRADGRPSGMDAAARIAPIRNCGITNSIARIARCSMSPRQRLKRNALIGGRPTNPPAPAAPEPVSPEPVGG